MRVRAAIVGSGNIGTDLLMKLRRSEVLEPAWMIGIEPDSPGLARARELGIETSAEGLDAVADRLVEDGVRIAFDATSARAHEAHAATLRARGILSIDLTPAALGPYCVPPVNLEEHVRADVPDLNMVTCGGQATIPIVAAVSRVQPVAYAEIIATIASLSAGPGTRKNIDEFTRTTARGLERVGGAERGKAIIILNPADPPLIMRNTVYCRTVEPLRADEVRTSIGEMIREVQGYVPGYRLKNDLVVEDDRVAVFLEVEGAGEFLPAYAGNLDIMTSAAKRVGELAAETLWGRLAAETAGAEASS